MAISSQATTLNVVLLDLLHMVDAPGLLEVVLLVVLRHYGSWQITEETKKAQDILHRSYMTRVFTEEWQCQRSGGPGDPRRAPLEIAEDS